MKYWLASLFLSVVGLTLGIGWCLDHMFLKAVIAELGEQYDQSLKYHWEAACTLADAKRLIVESRRYKEHDPDEPFSFDSNLVYMMSELCRYERDINLALEADNEFAVTHGHDILELLDCATVEGFYEIATTSFSSESDIEYFTEFHKVDSTEYQSLRDFVQRSINAGNVAERE